MAFVANNNSLLRRDVRAFIGDSGVRADSAKYEYGFVTADTAAVVEAAGYFDAATYLQQGDTIGAVMNCGVGQTPVLKTYLVTANNVASGGHIVLALGSTTLG